MFPSFSSFSFTAVSAASGISIAVVLGFLVGIFPPDRYEVCRCYPRDDAFRSKPIMKRRGFFFSTICLYPAARISYHIVSPLFFCLRFSRSELRGRVCLQKLSASGPRLTPYTAVGQHVHGRIFTDTSPGNLVKSFKGSLP